MNRPDDIQGRVELFLAARDLVVNSCLGAGTQGTVFLLRSLSRSQSSAVKFHDREVAYRRELDAYHRLQDLSIQQVQECMVPQLIDHDDNLLAIAMTIVSPPFVLDFGGAYVDQPPDYSPEVWDDWRRQKTGRFRRSLARRPANPRRI